LKIKQSLTKAKRNIKRIRAELKKIKQHKLWLKDKIENNKTLIKKSQEKKSKIKRIRTKLKTIIYDKL